MAESLKVNGKEYVLSSTLTASSKYTSDYIGRLAREEKILGLRVGRQWFIEPESLKIFLLQAEFEKEIRKETLRAERKLEQKNKPLQQEEVKIPLLHLGLVAETLVVVFCGLFIGGLGHVALVEKIGANEIVVGTGESLSFVTKSIVPTENILTSKISSESSLAASTEGLIPKSLQPKNIEVIFTVLPIFPPRELLFVPSSTAAFPTDIVDSIQFSDEVQITVDASGNQFIEPVFKNKATSSHLNRFLLVPANKGKN